MSNETELQTVIREYKEYVLSGEGNSDRCGKYEHAILEAAIEQELGEGWWDTANPIMSKW